MKKIDELVNKACLDELARIEPEPVDEQAVRDRVFAKLGLDPLEKPVKAPRHFRKKRRGLRYTLAGVGTAAACFLALLTVNAANPAFAEELPLVGRLFRQYNYQSKTAVGTYVGTYGKVEQINSQAEGENAGELALTAKEAYSDGEYLHIAFTMEAPSDYLEKYYYLFLPLNLTVNGETEEESGLSLSPAQSRFEGTVSLKLETPAEDGAALSVSYKAAKIQGYYNGGADFEDLPGTFSGSLKVTADASHNWSADQFDSSGEIRINSIEATPSYTKISYEIPFWGIGEYTVDYPKLYTLDGTPIRGTVVYGDTPSPNSISPEAETISSSHMFDGLPSGTEQVILRFLEDWVDDGEDMIAVYTDSNGNWIRRKVGVLGEVTINLATGEAVPSQTYLDDGLSSAGDFRENYQQLHWHAGFDDIRHREGAPRQMDLFEAADLFQNGIALESLEYAKDSGFTINFMATATLEQDLSLTIAGEDGQPLASGSISKDGVKDNPYLLGYDSMEDLLASEEQKLRELLQGEEDQEEMVQNELEAIKNSSKPGQYYFRGQPGLLPGKAPKLLDHLTITLSEPGTGKTLYQREIRLVRRD